MKIRLDKLRLMCNEVFDQLESRYEDISVADRTFWHVASKHSTKLYKPDAIVFDLDSTITDVNESILNRTKKSKIELEKLANILKAVANAIEKYEED